MHCFLATGGPGAAMPHAPFGRPRRPLGTFPRGESTSSARRRTKPPTRNRLFMDGKEKMLPCFSRFAGFRLCGGDQRAFRSPFGNLRPPCCGWKFPQEIRCFLAFPVSQGFASTEATKGLSGRPLETFGPYAADGNLHKNGLCQVINQQQKACQSGVSACLARFYSPVPPQPPSARSAASAMPSTSVVA